MLKKVASTALVIAFWVASGQAMAKCSDVNRAFLLTLAKAVVKQDNGGFHLPMWVTMVDETGKVCYVVNTAGSGANISKQSWLLSRVISAQKANTANGLSIDGFAISTGILFSTTHENASLQGLQFSNPVDPTAAYAGSPTLYGTPNDPLVGKRIGGVNVFGGGLALYNAGAAKKKVGAIGVSGDTSCTDHVVAWKIRKGLGLAVVPTGFTKKNFDAQGNLLNLTGDKGDEIIIDLDGDGFTYLPEGAAAWAHPPCANTPQHPKDAGAIIFDQDQPPV
jgi:uncharacterized protein GlcG (DUF336 family)